DNHLTTFDLSHVQEIGAGAFSSNKLKTVNLAHMTSVGSHAFEKNQIVNFILPTNMTKIPDSLFENNKLKTLQLSEKITEIGASAFAANYLSQIQLSNEMHTIGSRAFKDNQLTNIDLPLKLKKLGESSFKNNHLTTVVVPEGLQKIGSNAFEENQLKHVTLPDSLEVIDYAAFQENLIETIQLPEGIKQIDSYAFSNNQLKKLKIPSAMIKISSDSFSKNQLKTLTIPKNIQVIDLRAFKQNQLQNVTIEEGIKVWGEEALSQNPIEKITFSADEMPTFEKAMSQQNQMTKMDGNMLKGHIAWMTDEQLTTKWDGKTANTTIYRKWGYFPEIKGLEDAYVTIGEDFDFLKDVEAFDVEDGNLTQKITWDVNSLYKSKIGNYTIQYVVKDSDGLVRFYNRKLNVDTNTKPVITGKSKEIIPYNKYFDPFENVQVTDQEDGNLQEKTTVTGWDFDTTKPGIYKLTYRVKDARGNEAVFYKTVHVKPYKVYWNKQTSATARTIPVAWDQVVGASGYEVLLYNRNGKYLRKYDTKKTVYTFKELEPLTYYSFRVRAYKQVGSQRILGDLFIKERIVTAPSAPKIQWKKLKNDYRITWPRNANVSLYKIQCSTSKTFNKKYTRTLNSNKPLVYVGDPKNKKTYYVRVQAIKYYKDRQYTSAWSQVKVLK
ncbi:MAG: leucine-rich repeat protein, partial [Kurthia sp.]|nr:leucine-rich repeat protein [Kurthia sp.]